MKAGFPCSLPAVLGGERGAALKGAAWVGAVLGRAVFGGAVLGGAFLGGAVLGGAFLGEAFLVRAFLGGVLLAATRLLDDCGLIAGTRGSLPVKGRPSRPARQVFAAASNSS